MLRLHFAPQHSVHCGLISTFLQPSYANRFACSSKTSEPKQKPCVLTVDQTTNVSSVIRNYINNFKVATLTLFIRSKLIINSKLVTAGPWHFELQKYPSKGKLPIQKQLFQSGFEPGTSKIVLYTIVSHNLLVSKNA